MFNSLTESSVKIVLVFFRIFKNYPDLCLVWTNPTDILYGFFSQFEKKECPFPAGHRENFENGNIMDVPALVPNLGDNQGNYRLIMEMEIVHKLKRIKDCIKWNTNVVDV